MRGIWFFSLLLTVSGAAQAETRFGDPAPLRDPGAALDRAANLEIRTNLIDEETRQFLEQFRQNPRAARRQPLRKFNLGGTEPRVDRPELRGDGRTSFGLRLTENFHVANARTRRNFCLGTLENQQCLYEGNIENYQDVVNSGRRGIAGNDRAENLVDNGSVRSGQSRFRSNLFEMAEESLSKGEVAVQPWSGDYWAIAMGAAAKRYADPNYPQFSSGMVWHQLAPYMNSWYQRHGANLDAYIDQLSPAEKYDILVADPNFSLTRHQLNEGNSYAFDASGRPQAVEPWMGLCHGWAPAAYMEARPRQAITAYTPEGNPVNFRPDDVKALAILKWANGQTVVERNGRMENGTRFVGGRCGIKEDQIQTDPESGAILDDQCFDTNPGTWHKSVVNQIGVLQKSFIIDATFDYEVWNQPVVSYKYSYFNPRTMNTARTLRNAIEPIGFAGDRFANQRQERMGSGTRPTHVVGVVMEIVYVVEVAPSLAEENSEADDGLRTVRYQYDLELDENGEIVGGEWYSDAHPDFLWTPVRNAFAWNNQDAQVQERFDARRSLPWSISEVARRASSRGVVLKEVVDGLLRAAD